MTPSLALLLLAQRPSAPSNTAQAIARERQQYRFQLKRLFYANLAARKADDDRASALWASLLELRGKVGASPENLLRALGQYDAMRAIQAKMGYADMMPGMLDTRSGGSVGGEDEDERVGEDFVEEELRALDPKTFEAHVAAEPRLAPYRFRLERLWREKPHRLSARDEGILARLNPYAERWQEPIFEALRQEAPTLGGKEAKGVALLRLAGYKTSEARLRGFSDAVEASLFPLYLQRRTVDNLLKSLAGQRTLVDEVDRIVASASVRMATPPPFSVTLGTAVVRAALAPLGPEYGRELARLFDPRNGRMDIAGGPFRNGVGSGFGVPGTLPSLLYMPSYGGSYDDLDRGLSHEGGHAVHMELMRAGGVRPCYTEGPGYFFESFAMFNELLLADYLYRRQTVPGRRLYYLRELLAKLALPVDLAPGPDLEFSIYDGVAKGALSRTSQLDALEVKGYVKFYGYAGVPDPKAPNWATDELFYSHPLYSLNHVLGALLANAYYDAYRKSPQSFVPRYLALMRNGFDAPPRELLRRFLGVDLDDGALAARGGGEIRRRLAELRTLARTVAKG